MKPAALVRRLAGEGVRLSVDGGDLKCRGPKSALTPEVLADLKAHRAEVIAHLRPAPEPPPVKPAKVTPAAIERILESPPYWLAGSYLPAYRDGRCSLRGLAYAVTSALKIAGHGVSAYGDGDVDDVAQILLDTGWL